MGAALVIPQRDYYYSFQGNYVRSITSAQALARPCRIVELVLVPRNSRWCFHN